MARAGKGDLYICRNQSVGSSTGSWPMACWRNQSSISMKSSQALGLPKLRKPTSPPCVAPQSAWSPPPLGQFVNY